MLSWDRAVKRSPQLCTECPSPMQGRRALFPSTLCQGQKAPLQGVPVGFLGHHSKLWFFRSPGERWWGDVPTCLGSPRPQSPPSTRPWSATIQGWISYQVHVVRGQSLPSHPVQEGATSHLGSGLADDVDISGHQLPLPPSHPHTLPPLLQGARGNLHLPKVKMHSEHVLPAASHPGRQWPPDTPGLPLPFSHD